MVLIYLYHGDLYSDLWKSDLCFRPPATVVTLWVASCKMLFILVYDFMEPEWKNKDNYNNNNNCRTTHILGIADEMLPLDISSNNNLLLCSLQIVILHIQSVNKMLAKKLIDDKTRDYMNARRVAKVILDRHHGKEAGKTLKSLVLE